MGFKYFIEGIKTGISVAFSFDDQDKFDGFILTNTHLVIKTAYELSGTSIYIEIDDNNRDQIVKDLLNLHLIIDQMISKQQEYYKWLANPDLTNKEEDVE
jgi:hypothetical protein